MEIGKAQVVQEGNDLTVISWGAMMRPTQRAVSEIAEERNVSIELVDLLSMAPLDVETICESVKKTGRAVIVQEAPKSYGAAAEIIARINENALMHLEAPVKRVSSFDVMTPYFGREGDYFPGLASIRRSIEETLAF